MQLRISSLVAGAVLIAACSPPAADTFDPEDPAVVAAIDSIARIALEGSQNVDADQVLAMAEGSSDFSFITGDIMLSGFDRIHESFAKTYDGLESQSTTVLEQRIRVLSPNVAILTAVSEGSYTDKAGWTSELVGLGITLVFVRNDGEWRLEHAHQSVAP